jgi:hypothetical protein
MTAALTAYLLIEAPEWHRLPEHNVHLGAKALEDASKL